MTLSFVFILLGLMGFGGVAFFFAFLIPGVHDLRTRRCQLFGGITEEEQPTRYWIGIVIWFTLALVVLVLTIVGLSLTFRRRW